MFSIDEEKMDLFSFFQKIRFQWQKKQDIEKSFFNAHFSPKESRQIFWFFEQK